MKQKVEGIFLQALEKNQAHEETTNLLVDIK